MSFSLTCSCGRQYKVRAELAGKTIRCKQCGETMRVPEARDEAAGAGVDIFSLIDEPAPGPAAESIEDLPAGPGAWSRKQVPKGSKSKPATTIRRLKHDRPRGADPKLVIAGALGLVIAIVALVFGGRFAQSVRQGDGAGLPAGPVAARNAAAEPTDGPPEASSSVREAPASVPETPPSLPEARRGFQTKVVRRGPPGTPAPSAPPGVFRTVRFASPVGPLAAYVTPDPGDGARHPAIVWVTGGDSNTIDEGLWSEPDPENDQTASAYRKAGVILMFPSLRGGNDNPGVKEGFLGEVDDVLAAADFLAKQTYVDPARVYLGGHSTGGTLALLTAASTNRFRAVFCFGPVHDVRGYPREYVPFDTSDTREAALRAPALWLHSVRCPTFVIEGTQGNIGPLRELRSRSKNPLIHCLAVQGADHFNVLAPANRLIAEKILRDNDTRQPLELTENELKRAFAR